MGSRLCAEAEGGQAEGQAEDQVHLDPWQARASSSMGSRLCAEEEREEGQEDPVAATR